MADGWRLAFFHPLKEDLGKMEREADMVVGQSLSGWFRIFIWIQNKYLDKRIHRQFFGCCFSIHSFYKAAMGSGDSTFCGGERRRIFGGGRKWCVLTVWCDHDDGTIMPVGGRWHDRRNLGAFFLFCLVQRSVSYQKIKTRHCCIQQKKFFLLPSKKGFDKPHVQCHKLKNYSLLRWIETGAAIHWYCHTLAKTKTKFTVAIYL